MDFLSPEFAISIIETLGLPGLMFILWYVDGKRIDRLIQQSATNQNETRQMYVANVEVVRQTQQIAINSHDAIVHNAQVNQRLADRIETNRFCPLVRKNAGDADDARRN